MIKAVVVTDSEALWYMAHFCKSINPQEEPLTILLENWRGNETEVHIEW